MAPPTERLLTPAFVGLSIAELAYFTAFGVAIYTLPLYVTGPIGSDESGAGLAFGSFGVAALICRPYAGRLAETLGRRPLLIFGALTSGLGMLLMPMVDSLALIIVLRLLQGVAEAAFFVAGFAMLADIAPPGRMGEALSYISLGLYLGIAVGPVLAETLIGVGAFAKAWNGAAVLTVLAATISAFLPEKARTPSTEGPAALIHRPALPLSLGFFASLAAVSGVLAFASLYSEQIQLSNTSLALFLYGAVVVLCRIVFAKVPDRLPALPLATGSLVAIGLGLGLMAVAPSPLGFLAGVVLSAVGVSFSTPAFFAAIFATARPSERGAAAGTASAFMDLGLGFGPAALGLVAGAAGIPWAFGVGGTIAFLGAAWTLHLARSARVVPPTPTPLN
ncbi:MFS transporter [Arthrobacter sp. PAMC25284]|uniref:MFS transporter n=1 Tax=Arthrobacter sp. PAMC25284 TaxID=2861279 RepID=UPI001C6267EE|nr:MFS transporter [Arthrobacter sp. PAMC25284]QYF89153.1 MFS transporter [Arthrobacter sp. PAMC25284]